MSVIPVTEAEAEGLQVQGLPELLFTVLGVPSGYSSP